MALGGLPKESRRRDHFQGAEALSLQGDPSRGLRETTWGRPLLSGTVPSPAARLADEREAERLLESPLRQQIVDMVKTRPGVSVGDIMDELQVGWGTLYHHLTKLSRSKMIQTSVVGRRRLVYPVTPDADPTADKHMAMLRGKTARRVAEAVLAQPNIPIQELTTLLGESPRVVYYHVKRLLDAGLILSDSKTRHTGLAPAPQLATLLETSKPPAKRVAVEQP